MSASSPHVVVVGGSAAGLKCASRLARIAPGWRVTVVEERREFSYAACGLPYVLSGDVDDPNALRRTADGALRDEAYFARVKGLQLRVGWRATAIDPERRLLHLRSAAGETAELPWDFLVLATGAVPRRPSFVPSHPRVTAFHTLEDLKALRRGLERGELGHVAIVGAGLVGCELAEAFRALWGAEVTLLEREGWPLPAVVDREVGEVVAAALRAGGVRLFCDASVSAVAAGDEGVHITWPGGEVAADAVVVAVGVQPATELARTAAVKLDEGGAILVDERMATSVPGIWAVGDCVAVPHAVLPAPVCLPLGSLANREGRVAANVIAGRDDRLPPVAGAMAVKVFDCHVGATGITAAAARAQGWNAASVWVAAHDRAHYWPEADEIGLALVWDPATGRVLGVQGVGSAEVIKRIDVATQVITRRGSVDDLAHVEHAYAPPYAPALDPLAVVAFAAQNQEDGVAACSPLAELTDAAIVDVRHQDEREERPANGGRAFAVPLDELRDEARALEQGVTTVVCERGARAAEAVRILAAAGRQATYLGGGLRWRSLFRWGSP